MKWPLSWLQRPWWMHQVITPESCAANIYMTLWLGAQPNAEHVRRALAILAARHPLCRARMGIEDGRPVQVLAPPRDGQLEELAIITSPAATETACVAALRQHAERPFDLALDPPWRGVLMHAAPGSYLMVSAHHAVMDGHSSEVIRRELAELYMDLEQCREPALPPLAADYGEYVRLETAWMDGSEGQAARAYLLARLAEAREPLDLPRDVYGPRAPPAPSPGRRVELELPPDFARAVRQLGRRVRAPASLAYIAAWLCLLERYAQCDEAVLGLSVDCRPLPSHKAVVGNFVNFVPLCVRHARRDSALDLLSRVRAAVAELSPHRRFPQAALESEHGPLGDTPAHVPYQVGISTHASPLHSDVRQLFDLVDFGQTGAWLPWMLDIDESKRGTRLLFQYTSDACTTAFATDLLANYSALLEHMVADPGVAVAKLHLASSDAALGNRLAGRIEPRAEDPLTHEAVLAQAQRTPDRIALTCERESITYGELARRVERTATALRAAGLARGALVSVLVERSVDMVVALLAVWRVGAAYLPLDPDDPDERREFILADAHAHAMITRAGGQLQIAVSDATAAPPRGDGSTAYVIYTSGSTGKPKGVEVLHQGVGNFMTSMRDEPGVTESDVLVAITTVAFDIAALELFLPLLVGARVVIAARDVAVDGRRLAKLIEETEATVMQATPSSWRMLLAGGFRGRPKFRALCGGEPLTPDLASELLAREFEVWNLYGPTETTIWSTAERITDAAPPISVGRPIRATAAYVLDAFMEPLPFGVAGELHLGGAGLARGYLGRPELTDQRFVGNPFAPGERLYKTGDLARLLRDGRFEVLGRSDDQVKIRGFRVELGEVEASLREHPGVLDAAAIAESDPAGGKSLTAFIVPRSASLEVTELRAFMRGRVGSYMVPTRLLKIAALPRTANGKLDRKALTRAAATNQASERPAEPTRTRRPASPGDQTADGTEARLAELWRALLHVAKVESQQTFFELGGHSLLVLQLVAKIHEAFAVDLPVRAVFESPGLGELALAIDRARQDAPMGAASPSTFASKIDAAPAPGDGEPAGERAPLSFAQTRLWLVQSRSLSDTSYNMPGAVRIDGPLDAALLERCLNALVGRHAVLRTKIVSERGEPVALVLPARPVSLTHVSLSGREAELEDVLIGASRLPFALDREPLLRATLVRLDATHHVFLLVLHHAVADDWSVAVLFRELVTLYEGGGERALAALPPLAWQYQDFARWQRERLAPAAASSAVQAWLAALARARPLAELAAPPGVPFVGGRQSVWLTRAQRDALLAVGRSADATLFMVLLAAYVTAVGRLANADAPCIGVPVSERRRPELQHLVGCFINTVVFAVERASHPTFATLLAAVRLEWLAILSRSEVPFDWVVRAVSQQRGEAAVLFNVLFAFQNSPLEVFDAAGLHFAIERFKQPTAKYDLSLAVEDRDEGLLLVIEYNAAALDATRIAEFIASLRDLLDRVARDGDAVQGEHVSAPDPRKTGEPATRPHVAALPFVAPRDALERTVAQAWREAFAAVDPSTASRALSVHDHFFALGGHSLLAMQVVERLVERGYAGLRVTDLFAYPTIGELAIRLRQEAPGGPTEPEQRARAQRTAVARLRKTRSKP